VGPAVGGAAMVVVGVGGARVVAEPDLVVMGVGVMGVGVGLVLSSMQAPLPCISPRAA